MRYTVSCLLPTKLHSSFEFKKPKSFNNLYWNVNASGGFLLCLDFCPFLLSKLRNQNPVTFKGLKMQKLFSSFKTSVHHKVNMNSLELSYAKSNFTHRSNLDYVWPSEISHWQILGYSSPPHFFSLQHHYFNYLPCKLKDALRDLITTQIS